MQNGQAKSNMPEQEAIDGAIDEEALRLAIELMEEYPEVFEELAK